MDARLDTSGIPKRIDSSFITRRYGQNFPLLLRDPNKGIIDSSIDDVYAMFPGVSELWARLPIDLWVSKTQLCYGLLVAWYIADVYPKYAAGVPSSGAIPIASKSIGGVKVQFAKPTASDMWTTLSALKSNSFGMKAFQMIRSSSTTNAIR